MRSKQVRNNFEAKFEEKLKVKARSWKVKAKQSWVSKMNIKYQQSDRKTNKKRW